MNRCLYCYENIDSGIYHVPCSRRLFGTSKPPILDYTLDELYSLAVQSFFTATVPGVQPKMSLARFSENKCDKLTFFGMLGDYIMKPQVRSYRALPENEALTMHMAAIAGIDIAPCGLLPLASGELVYITLRMDRLVAGTRGLKKVKRHMEDFCQATEHSTEHKYRGSMELVARTIRKFSDTPGLDLVNILKRTLFFFLTGNADMHLKNFSFLYDGPAKRLAPAYDLLSTRLVISEKDDPEEMALTINGRKNRLKLGDFAIFSKNIGLNTKQFQTACDGLATQLPAMLELVQKSFLPEDLKKAYGELLRERAVLLGLWP